MNRIEGKRILFFAPAFFEYEKKIADKMSELGAIVDLYDERSVTKPFERAMLKISPTIFRKRTLEYFQNILEANKFKQYDYILVIKCEMMPIEIIKSLRSRYPSAIFCLYLYDSLKNIKGILPKLSEFDRVLSFDSTDVQNFKSIIFRPLFFIDIYRKPANSNNQFLFDLCFIGTIHSDRYSMIKKFKEHAKQKNLKYYFYCYLQSKSIYRFYRLTKREFRNTTSSDFNFKKISSSKIAAIIDQTRVILDIQHPGQTGLTMRTIEMLGMNKKLITTNHAVKTYDFYNSDNILVIDRNNMDIPADFFIKPYQKINDDTYSRYSLQNWIYEVLGC